MLKLFIFFSLTILISMLSSCNHDKDESKSLEVKSEDNSLSVFFNGSIRLKGLFLALENSKINRNKFSISSNRIEFLEGNQQNSIEYEASNGVLLFSMSSTFKQPKAEDFVGLFVDSIPNFEVGTSFYKYGSVKAWTHPVHINTINDLNIGDNQFFLWKYHDGLYAAAMPLAGNGFVSQLGKFEGLFGSKSYSLVDSSEIMNVPVLAIAFGKNPYETIRNVYEEGLKFIGKENGLRKNKVYPPFFEKLMWCTWNSLGHDISEQNILLAMEEFKKSGITIPYVLLDDGWSTVSEYGKGRLQRFEVNPTKFPHGLKYLVEKLKVDYGVKEVGVWHAFNGYWAGIDPESELGIKYRNDLLKYRDRVAWSSDSIGDFYFVNPMAKAGFQFYDDWYTYLKAEGISFVKVDNQLIADRIAKNNFPFSKLAEAMQKNLQSAVKKHFDGNVLNCMDMTTDAVYNFDSSPIGRSSEDFFPANTTYNIEAGNAAIHVICNAYNSLWWSQMVWSDFDMFQSDHPNAEYHAIARALNGGPIYISDSIGKSNAGIINKLVLKDGTILRSDQPAMPTEDCLFASQGEKPLKIFSISDKAGLLGVFNAADRDTVNGFFSPKDINGLEGKNFAVYYYLDQKVLKAGKDAQIPIQVGRLACELFVIKAIKNKFASIGLINKYNSPKTIKKEIVQDKLALIELFESGTFAAYTEKIPLRVVTENDIPLKYTLKEDLLLIHLPEGVTKIGIQF